MVELLDDLVLRHNCGIVVSHSLHDTYCFLKSLQHRGREAAGIAAISDERIDVVKYSGKVEAISNMTIHKIFPKKNKYHTFMGHIRYATKGRKSDILNDAHPHVIGGRVIHNGSHVIIRDVDMAIVHNGQVDLTNYMNNINKRNLKTGCDSEALLHLYKNGMNEFDIIKEIPGAYTLAIADRRREEVMVLRDSSGIKPGVLGWKDGAYFVVSEDVAITEHKLTFEHDLKPGYIYYFNSNGEFRSEKAKDEILKYCFFEWNYLAHPDTNLNGTPVRNLRDSLGRKLAEEFAPDDIDVVTYLPDSPLRAAKTYALYAMKPFETLFYKFRSERSFQGSTNEDRKNSIKQNLYLRDTEIKHIKDKVVCVIDDSIVRGTNASRAINMLKDLGAKKIYFLSYTPALGRIGKDGIMRGCEFGVDMPPEHNEHHQFIARGRDVYEISKKLGARVHYLSEKKMFEAFKENGLDKKDMCYFCIGGKHPFKE